MNDYVKEKLKKLSAVLLPRERTKLPLNFHLSRMEKKFVSIPSDIILEAINQFEEKYLEGSNKSFAYFEAMVMSKSEEKSKAKDKEKMRLGHLPKNIT